jgi:hypothetical protein
MKKLIGIWISVLLLTGTVYSQETQKPPSVPPIISEIDQLLQALAEIDWLNAVQPLDLKPEQMDKLIEANQKALQKVKDLFANEGKELKAKKEQILKIRAEAVQGKIAPKEFVEEMKELEKKALQKRAELRIEAVRNAGKEMKPIFTEDQMKHMIKRSREVLKERKVDVEKATDDQLYWFFVENVFLSESAPVLLKEMKGKR